MTAYLGQYPAPTLTIAHISDTHFVGTGDALYSVVDPDALLTELFAGFERGNVRPDVLLFTGDLTDAGRVDAYGRLRFQVEAAAQRLGAEIIWVMGNHDDRGAFRTELLDEEAGSAPIDRVHWVDGVRIIALDTTVPGRAHGEISTGQLEWLTEILREPAPRGSILAMHHPPVPTPVGTLALVELREQARLEPVLRGSDVRAIVAGHLHYSTHSTFAGIPVSVASATCYTFDLQTEYPVARAVNAAQSFSLIHVYEDRLVHSVIPIGDAPILHELTPEILRPLLGEEDTASA